MSTESQVLVGYFIKAKRGTAKQVDRDFCCTTNHEHPLSNPIPKFCPECGAKMDYVNIEWDMPMALWDLQCGGEYDWIGRMPEIDVIWINALFSAVDTFSVGVEDDYDYIMCNGSDDVDGLDSGVHTMSVTEVCCPPNLEDIKRLQQLMNYETTELLFGALVSIST